MNLSQFQKAVDFAAKAIGGRMSSAVLECVHLVSDGTKATATGTNMDISCRMSFDCDVPLNACVPAGRLKKALTEIPADEITLSATEKDITLSWGQPKIRIETQNPQYFPAWEGVEGDDFDIPADALSRIIPFVHPDWSTGFKNAVWFDDEFIAASDGRRMACLKNNVGVSCLVPIGVARLLSSLEGKMRVNDGKFAASGDEWEVTGKLMEGVVPKQWRKMAPVTTKSYPIPDSFREVLSRGVGLWVNTDKTGSYRFTLKGGVFDCQDYSDITDMDAELTSIRTPRTSFRRSRAQRASV